jgi:hypothetical protein
MDKLGELTELRWRYDRKSQIARITAYNFTYAAQKLLVLGAHLETV